MAALRTAEQRDETFRVLGELEVPASTAWPLVLASGLTLMFAGLLTSESVSVLGAALALAGCVGWFLEVFPNEHEEAVPVYPEALSVATSRRFIERLPLAGEQTRACVPVETDPIS